MEYHVTSPLMRGPQVERLQSMLDSLGLAPGAIDGFYGPVTAAALERFTAQADPDHRLAPPGVFNDAIYAVLTKAVESTPLSVIVPSTSSPGFLALLEAQKHLGVKEEPPGSNRTEFGEWFGVNGVAWCAIFVSYCFVVGASYILCDGVKGAGCKRGKGCSYVPTVLGWLKLNGHWIGKSIPQPGDIVIFNWDHVGIPEHIGLVEKWIGGPRGKFLTIEGNSGGQVKRNERYLQSIDGFGRIT